MLGNHSTRLGAAAALCIVAAGSPLASGTRAATHAEGKAAAMHAQAKANSSGVVMRYSVPEKIAIGESVTLKLQFSGVTATDGATVQVRDPATGTRLLSMHLAPGEYKLIELPYTGRADGMQFIDVTTTQAGRSTVQSVPLRVGSGAVRLKREGQRRVTPAGEAVISLPAASPGSSR